MVSAASLSSFSYTLIPPSDNSWGQRLDNGQWDGPIGMLTRKVTKLTLRIPSGFEIVLNSASGQCYKASVFRLASVRISLSSLADYIYSFPGSGGWWYWLHRYLLLSFAIYTVSPISKVNWAVFCRSSLHPYSFVCNAVSVGQVVLLRLSWFGHRYKSWRISSS